MVFALRPILLLCLAFVSFNIHAQSFNNGGNSFGAAAVLGTNDNYPLNIYTNGSNRMTIGTNGWVGIGTTNPLALLDVESTSNNAGAFLRTTYSFSQAFVQVKNDGNAYFTFKTYGSNYPGSYQGITLANLNVLEGGGQNMLISYVVGPLIFANGTAENMRITHAGLVGIGTSTPSQLLQVGASGDGTSALANSWSTFSDARLKNISGRIKNAPEIIDQLNGYYFTWKNGANSTQQVGVSAQEVEAVLPELVTTNADGLKAVDYSKLTAVLIEATKEYQREIADLNKRLAAIEKTLARQDLQ